MFQLPFGGFIPAFGVDSQFTDTVKFESKDTLRRHFKMSGLKKSVIRNMELLVIDEVSMLRADLLDAMDYMMQCVRIRILGVQVLFDLLQLPPVIRDEEWRTLRYYKGKFFFIRMPYSKVRHYTLSYPQYTVRLTPSFFGFE
jgi:hypothetical protein